VTHKREYIERANALLFHARDVDFSDLPSRKENQPWVLFTMETPLSDPWTLKPELVRHFDYFMGYQLNSDFPVPYYYDVTESLLKPLNPFKREVPILWAGSNCNTFSGREYYIQELMKYIPIDSYGSCLNNMQFPPNLTLNELAREYKFYLAMENANCKDYVSEKTLRALTEGVLPIVDGPDDYSLFAPTNKALIKSTFNTFPTNLESNLMKNLSRNGETGNLGIVYFVDTSTAIGN